MADQIFSASTSIAFSQTLPSLQCSFLSSSSEAVTTLSPTSTVKLLGVKMLMVVCLPSFQVSVVQSMTPPAHFPWKSALSDSTKPASAPDANAPLKATAIL
eukprot:CAMPEP_0169388500 /NCGR_PEP_ID=MMETSP1017-20121227/46104_1 /TAXON_ID=342587 /ORGANISM="Karlodinium micrum, Strain CCMP2283" /LENGTH=100 /DNA_ID=CAMNT_0009490349 /DNA_START=138 /DNA_END=437 /DNA_ORIENTATION=-